MAKLSRFAGVEEIEPCVNRAAAIVEEVAWESADDDEFCDRAVEVYGWVTTRTHSEKATGERRVCS